MKRGNVRTKKKYITDSDGNKTIKFEIQGKRNGIWMTVYEMDNKTKKKTPMIYDTIGEAEKQLLKIVKQIKGR
jgi:hypothetical protein